MMEPDRSVPVNTPPPALISVPSALNTSPCLRLYVYVCPASKPPSVFADGINSMVVVPVSVAIAYMKQLELASFEF